MYQMNQVYEKKEERGKAYELFKETTYKAPIGDISLVIDKLQGGHINFFSELPKRDSEKKNIEKIVRC